MSKNDQNLDRFQNRLSVFQGVARRTAWSSWGENRGVINANDVRKFDVVRLLRQFLATTWPFEDTTKTGQ